MILCDGGAGFRHREIELALAVLEIAGVSFEMLGGGDAPRYAGSKGVGFPQTMMCDIKQTQERICGRGSNRICGPP